MKILIENWRKFINEEEKKNISYSAVMLDQNSIKKLIDTFGDKKPETFVYEAPDYHLPHHMTITLGPLGQYAGDYQAGKQITLEVVGYGISNDAMAIQVKPPFPINSKQIPIPHITFALPPPPNGKPFLSNKIQNWTTKINPFNISGIVEEVPQKSEKK